MVIKDQAVCIRKVDYSETSQVLTFLTRLHGKIAVMAKGSKRQKSSTGGPVEIFSCGEMIFYPSETAKLATLKEFEQKPMFMPLRRNLFAMNCALFGAELVDHFTHEHDPHAELFDSFLQYLSEVQLTQNNSEALAMLVLFQLTVLSEFGSRLILDRCANCSAKWTESERDTYFCSSANGLVCAGCESAYIDKIKLNKAVSNCLTDLRNLKNADQRVLREVEKIMIYHLTEILHKQPRLAKYFV